MVIAKTTRLTTILCVLLMLGCAVSVFVITGSATGANLILSSPTAIGVCEYGEYGQSSTTAGNFQARNDGNTSHLANYGGDVAEFFVSRGFTEYDNPHWPIGTPPFVSDPTITDVKLLIVYTTGHINKGWLSYSFGDLTTNLQGIEYNAVGNWGNRANTPSWAGWTNSTTFSENFSDPGTPKFNVWDCTANENWNLSMLQSGDFNVMWTTERNASGFDIDYLGIYYAWDNTLVRPSGSANSFILRPDGTVNMEGYNRSNHAQDPYVMVNETTAGSDGPGTTISANYTGGGFYPAVSLHNADFTLTNCPSSVNADDRYTVQVWGIARESSNQSGFGRVYFALLDTNAIAYNASYNATVYPWTNYTSPWFRANVWSNTSGYDLAQLDALQLTIAVWSENNTPTGHLDISQLAVLCVLLQPSSSDRLFPINWNASWVVNIFILTFSFVGFVGMIAFPALAIGSRNPKEDKLGSLAGFVITECVFIAMFVFGIASALGRI